MTSTKDRFINLWQKHSLEEKTDVAENILSHLKMLYSEPWRSYHNLDHIQACLAYFDACKKHADCADAIELAIWFHDCIYEVGAKDNEECSRDWFRLKSHTYLSNTLRDKVSQLIMDTSRIEIPGNNDGRLIVDIDLTSFGLPWNEFLSDSKAVYNELLETCDDIAIISGKFLTGMLKKPHIYYTPYYRQHYEHQAKLNIIRYIDLLRAQHGLNH